MNYEHIEGYPNPNETLPDGKPRAWGYFGYPSAAVDIALRRDDPIGLRKMYNLGWITVQSETLDQLTMPEYAMKLGAVKCADMLKSIGFKAAA